MKLSEIHTNPDNPRIIKDERFKKLVSSISEFPKMMELRPIIIDESGMILGGNMRFKALQELNTILLNAYLINKVSTVMKLKGGNQSELYQNNAHEKKILKAKSLEAVWPQYVETVMRFNRPHHYVNWKKHFKQPLKRKEAA